MELILVVDVHKATCQDFQKSLRKGRNNFRSNSFRRAENDFCALLRSFIDVDGKGRFCITGGRTGGLGSVTTFFCYNC
jgi:hypothetical protein